MIDNVVGSAAIKIDPILDQAEMRKFQRQMQAMGSAAAKGANRAMKRDLGFDSIKAAVPQISEAIAKERVKARKQLKGLSSDFQQEIRAGESLDRQRTRSLRTAADEQSRILKSLSDDYDRTLKAQAADLKVADKAAQDFGTSADAAFRKAAMSGTGMDLAAQQTKKLGTEMTNVGHLHAANFLDGMYKAGSALSQIGTRVGMLGFQMQMIGRQMSTFVSLPIAAVGVGSAAVGLKQAAAIESAMRGMVALKPNENIVPFFKSMLDFAEQSPVFEAGPLLDSIRGLAAAGLETEKIDKVVRAMGNIGLTVGVEPQQMSRAFYAIKQIVTKGRVYAEELRQQLGDAIPGIDAMLAEGLGLDQQGLQELLEAKEFSADKFIEAIVNVGNSKRFLEGAATGVNSLNAAWAGLIETSKNTLAKQFMTDDLSVRPEITEGLQKLSRAIQSLIKEAGASGVFDAMIAGFTKFVGLIEKVVTAYGNLSDSQKDMIPKIALAAAAFGPLLQMFGSLASIAAAGIGALGTLGITIGSLATPVGAAALAVVGLGAAVSGAFAIAYLKIEEFRNKMNQVGMSMVNFFDNNIVPAIDGVLTEFLRLGIMLKNIGLDWQLFGDIVLWTGRILGSSIVATLKVVEVSLGMFRGVIYTVLEAWNFVLDGFRQGVAPLVKLIDVLPGDAFAEATGPLDELWRGMRDFSQGTWGAVDAQKILQESNAGTVQTNLSLRDSLSGLGGMFDATTGKVQTLSGAIDTYMGKMDAAKQQTAAAKSADEAFRVAKDNLKKSVEENGKSIEGNSKAALGNRDALKSATQASFDKMLQDIKSGEPMANAIQKHKDRTKALQDEFGKTKETKQKTDDYINSLNLVPKDVSTLLKLIDYKPVAAELLKLNIQQDALKRGVSFDQAKKDHDVNRRTGGTGAGWHDGGWTGPGSKMQEAGIVHADEHVIRKWARRRIESTDPGLLDYVNAYGQLPPQYAQGGRVTWPFDVTAKMTKIDKSWAAGSGFVNSGGSGGPGQYQAMFNWIKSRVPGTNLTSGLRPGDPGYHGKGRAVDLTFSDGSERRGGGLALKAFNLIKSSFMKSIKELIWDFAKGNAVWNGSNHFFTGAGAGPGTHDDHIHWANDRGGPLPPGVGTNYSNQTEMVLNAAQGAALERRLEPDDPPIVKVYIGDTELKGMIRVEVEDSRKKKISSLSRGRGGRG